MASPHVGEVNLWNLASGNKVATLTGHGSGSNVLFSPDGTWLAASTEGEQMVRLWHATDWR
jgi:WD40 repeat protein